MNKSSSKGKNIKRNKKIVNQYNLKGNITIKNVNRYSIENILLSSANNVTNKKDNDNLNIIKKLRNEFDEITNHKKSYKDQILLTSINDQSSDEEAPSYKDNNDDELIQSMNSSVINTTENIINYNDFNCINKQISFSIKSNSNNNETIKKLTIIIQTLMKYIKAQEDVILKYNKEFAEKIVMNEHYKGLVQERMLNDYLIKQNKELKSKFITLYDSVKEYEEETKKIRNKSISIQYQLLKENEYLRKCIYDVNKTNNTNISRNVKEKEDNKFDVIKNTTINKKEKRMKEIEAELKMITEGNFEMF